MSLNLYELGFASCIILSLLYVGGGLSNPWNQLPRQALMQGVGNPWQTYGKVQGQQQQSQLMRNIGMGGGRRGGMGAMGGMALPGMGAGMGAAGGMFG